MKIKRDTDYLFGRKYISIESRPGNHIIDNYRGLRVDIHSTNLEWRISRFFSTWSVSTLLEIEDPNDPLCLESSFSFVVYGLTSKRDVISAAKDRIDLYRESEAPETKTSIMLRQANIIRRSKC